MRAVALAVVLMLAPALAAATPLRAQDLAGESSAARALQPAADARLVVPAVPLQVELRPVSPLALSTTAADSARGDYGLEGLLIVGAVTGLVVGWYATRLGETSTFSMSGFVVGFAIGSLPGMAIGGVIGGQIKKPLPVDDGEEQTSADPIGGG